MTPLAKCTFPLKYSVLVNISDIFKELGQHVVVIWLDSVIKKQIKQFTFTCRKWGPLCASLLSHMIKCLNVIKMTYFNSTAKDFLAVTA